MKKLLPAFALLIAPLAAFSQARLMINGTTPVYMVENGGVAANPIYIEVNNPAPDAITETGGNGWIISESEFNMVKWDLTTAGSPTGAYVVPFGYSTSYYLPITINLTSIGNPPANGGVKFSTWHTVADNATGVMSVSGVPSDPGMNMHAMYNNAATAFPSVTDDSYNVVDRFWIMDETGYSAAPTLSGNGVALSYIHAGLPEFAAPNIAADEADLVAQRFNTGIKSWGDWLGTGALQSSVGNIGTVFTGQTITSWYRSWTLSNSINPLPVDISSFTTQCDNGVALIQWTAETQLDNAYFTIKKTADGIHFETVGTVAGAGTTDLQKMYSFTDNNPYAGTSYYFLYQTDYDNQMSPTLSQTQFVGCGGESTTSVTAFNSTNNIVVRINSTNYDNVNITLTNMLGQTISNSNHAVALGENEIDLNNTLAAGVYIISVKNDKVNFTKKLVIGVR